MNVLIVEDNDDWAELICIALRISGYESVKARLLSQALDLMRANRFDAVMLDLYLPDSGGAATALKVLEVDPDLPIVVVTGMAPDFVNVKLPLGVVKILDKMKTSPEQLIQALELAAKQREVRAIKQEVVQSLTDTGRAAKDLGMAAEAVKQSVDEIKKTLDEAKPPA